MDQYRVVCTEQVPEYAHPLNAKIVAVGTGNGSDSAQYRWTVAQVVTAMDNGSVFYTRGDRSGKVARVEKYWCSACGEYHIRSSADAVIDNNLDSLRGCRFGA